MRSRNCNADNDQNADKKLARGELIHRSLLNTRKESVARSKRHQAVLNADNLWCLILRMEIYESTPLPTVSEHAIE